MSDFAHKEWLLNVASTDIDKQLHISEADFNWLQERLRKLARDLEQQDK